MIVRSKEELRGDTQNIAYVMKKCLYKDMENEIYNSQLFVMKSWLLYYLCGFLKQSIVSRRTATCFCERPTMDIVEVFSMPSR